MRRVALLLAACVAAVSAAGLWAQQADSLPSTNNLPVASQPVPRLIMFSGTVKDLTGKPLTGPLDLNFAIYKEQTDAAPLWQESQTLNLDEQGHYTALLGAMQGEGLPVDLFTSGEARWLGVSAGKLAEQPRVLLVSVPYALKAGDAATLGGKPASAYALAEPAGASTSAGTASAGTAGPAGAATSELAAPGKPKSGPKPNVAGTGTQNYIPLWTDSVGTLGNSVMYQSGSNISIGSTSNPGYRLDVVGGSARITNPSGTTQLTVSGSATSGRLGQDAAGFFFSSDTNGAAVRFLTNNGSLHEWMRITSAGNVGIGTINPAYPLDVQGASARIANPSGTTQLVVSGSASSGRLGQDASGFFFSSDTNGGALRFLTNNGSGHEWMRISSAGNVGVGTATPAHVLDVVGDINASTNLTAGGNLSVTGTINGNGAGLTNVTATTAATAATANGLVCTGCVGNTQLGVNYAASTSQGGAASNALLLNGLASSAFQAAGSYAVITGPNSFAGTQTVSGGNVGIGTTGPVSALNVAGTTGLTWTNGGNNLGLATFGTPATGGSLYLNTPSLSSSFQSGLGIDGTYGTPSQQSVINIRALGVHSGGAYGSQLAFWTSNGTVLDQQMTIDKAGNVGIGTATPAHVLDVVGDINASTNIIAGGNLSVTGTITGNGSGLTGVSASGLAAGTYNNAYSFTNAANSFTGSGAGLTSLNPANLSSGTAGISITGNAATATNATSATTATTATNATQLGGVAASGYPQLATANTYTSGKQTFVASATSAATLNIPSGVAPSAPASGDFWDLSGILQFYDGTHTNSLTTIQTAPTSGHLAVWSGTAGLLADGGAPATGTVTSVGVVGTANQITVTGASPITTSGSWTLSFPSGGVTLPGTTTGTFSGNLTGNVTGNVSGSSGSTTGNAATATALAATPTQCGSNNWATGIAASGAANCSRPGYSNLSGTLPSAALSGTYSGAVTLSNAGNNFTGNGSGLTNVAAATATTAATATNALALGSVAAANYARLDIGNGFTGNQAVTGNLSITGLLNSALVLQPSITDVSGSSTSGVDYCFSGSACVSANVVAGYGVGTTAGSGANTILAGVMGATIGGGGGTYAGTTDFGNLVTDDWGTVGGGYFNWAGNNANSLSDAVGATVGGGGGNWAAGNFATIAGGQGNYAVDYGTVDGGYSNVASGYEATVVGGDTNTASGDLSFAAGCQATAANDGSFVWSGYNGTACTTVTSSASGQFLALAPGGVIFYSNTALSAGVSLAAGGGSWSSVSDRNVKANFKPVNGESLLARLNDLHMSTWNYKAQDSRFRHLGPMAQDFYGAFRLGEDDKHIDDIDGQGVALAGVQALYRLSLKKDAEIQEQHAQIQTLTSEVQKLRARDEKLSRQVQEMEKVQRQMATLEARLAQIEARRAKPQPRSVKRTAPARPAPGSVTLAKAQF